MDYGAGISYEQEEADTEVTRYERTRGFATTNGQEYEVALCCLLYLRALRVTSDFFLASNHGGAGIFDDVVLFYLLKEDQGRTYRAILLQAKHRERVTPKKLTSSNPFRLNEYLKSFNDMRQHWEHPMKVGNREMQFQEITLVLYTNTDCEIGNNAVDVTDKPEVQHLQDLVNTGGCLLRISEAQGEKLFKGKETSDFLAHLLLCIQQASVQKVDSFLEQEISNLLKLKSSDVTRNLISELKCRMRTWWGAEGRVPYLTPECREWKETLDIQVKRMNKRTLNMDRRLNIRFASAVLQRFEVFHQGMKTSWICVRDEYQGYAVRSRIFRAQRYTLAVDFKSLDDQLEEVEALWRNNICPTLVLDMSTVSSEDGLLVLHRLQKEIQSDASRNLIVIAKERPRSKGWKIRKAVSTWSILHQDTRDRLMLAPVLLQGKAVELRDVVGFHVTDVMTDKVITDLSVRENPIVLGAALPAPLAYYVPRCLERTSLNAINFDLLLKTNRLIFFSSSYLPLNEFKNRFKILSLFEVQTAKHIAEPTFVKDTTNDFDIRQLCFRFRVPGISGEISMKGLRGNVKEFIPFTWNCDEKIVVIEGLPGVGKSSFMTMMCSNVKEQFPEAWVLRINMGQHTDYIKDTDFTEVNNVKELLLKCLSKDPSHLERQLLEHSLSVKGNIFLFIDAFDEINPDYTRKCCDLLKGLAETFKYRQMVVTTRPVTTTDVEEALQTRAFNLPVFNKEQEKLFLKQFSAAKGKNVGDEEICSVHQTAGSVLQIPLLCRMAAEILVHCREQRLHQFMNPWRRVLLYQLFVEQSVTEHVANFRVDMSIPGANSIVEASKKTHLENLQGLAVRKLMLPLPVSSIMPDEKLGFVVKTRDRVDFEHETFAEYFLGRWLACHWRKCPRQLLLDLLFRDSFAFGAATFSWSLFEGFPLHMAVARGDEDTVRALVAAGTTDRGGRTALHVAAMTTGDHRKVWELLLDSGEDLNKKDDVLGTNSIRYAAISSNWEFVDVFLEKKCDMPFNAVGSADMQILVYAIRRDLTSMCQAMLSKENGNLYQFDNEGNTLLHMATANNSIGVMKLLMEMRHKLNVKNKSGYTPLRQAMQQGKMDAVRLLVESGADLNLKTEDGFTALTWAAFKGHMDVVRILLDNGADLDRKDEDGFTALIIAVFKGHLEFVKVLLKNGADLNIKTDKGDTALIVAAAKGNLEVMLILLQNGPDLNIKNEHGATALIIAAQEGHLVVVQMLLENGPDLNIKNKYGATALIIAVQEGHLTVVNILLEKGAHLNIKTEKGATALTIAAEVGHLEVIKLLLENGADLDIKNEDGATALIIAAQKGHLEVVKVLLEHRPDLNIKTVKGATALIIAAQKGHLEVVKILIDNGADLNIKTEKGGTALLFAALIGNLEVVKLLLENGSDLNVKTEDGATALIIAAFKGHLEVVKMLVKNGADVKAKDLKGESALTLASREGHHKVVAFLKLL